MKKYKKLFSGVLITFLLSTILYINVNAATGYEGYAIYRDGVFFETEWHAGIMDEPYSTDYKPVTHHPGGFGSDDVVTWDTWDNFMDGKTFKGVYRPNSNPGSSERDLFVAMGRKLIAEKIPYNLAFQVYYDTGTSGAWVGYDEISSIRCDGVVEYIYEWYGHRVFGNDTHWDVTKNSFWGRDHHSGTLVTPKRQANYLTRVTSSVPKE